jgi:hypothetical protein
MMIISVIDLALWDLLGKIRGEPVYKLIGGQTKEHLIAYCTGPNPDLAKEQGYWGNKVPLPYSPTEPDSLQKNYDVLANHRKKGGRGFPIMVDCYMSLNISYAIKLITNARTSRLSGGRKSSVRMIQKVMSCSSRLSPKSDGRRESTSTPGMGFGNWLKGDCWMYYNRIFSGVEVSRSF